MSKRLYVPIDIDFGVNPTVAQAGRLGWLVFMYLLAAHKKSPAEGLVSPTHSSPLACRVGLAAFAFTDDEAEQGLRDAEAAGLIERRDAGVYIVNWADWAGPKSSTERSQERRAKLEAEARKRAGHDQRNDVQRDATPTQRDATKPLDLTCLGLHSSQGVKKSTPQERERADELCSASPDLREVGNIAKVLGAAKWGNGEKPRAKEARRLAALGFGAEDVKAAWLHATDRGREPLRLFASILKEPSRINDAVAARRKAADPPGARNGPGEDPRHVGAVLRKVVG